MTDQLKPFFDSAACLRSARHERPTRRFWITLAFLASLWGCGGTDNPGTLGSLAPYFHTSYSGMMLNTEPDEGAITDIGRTYRGSVRPQNAEAVAGVQFLLGNMTKNQIRGAKMIAGISTNFNAEQLPAPKGTINNQITNNPETGWVQVKIGGAGDLPIPASVDGENGAGLAWTDLIAVANSYAPGSFEIVWRIWVPARSVAPYARTFSGTIDGGLPAERLSAIRGLSVFEYDIRGLEPWYDSSYMHYGFAEGDAVSNPATPKTWFTTPSPPEHWNAYSHLATHHPDPPTQVKAVAAVPVLGFRWKATRSLPVIEIVGDSITQGYGDKVGDQVVGVDGYPGRLVRALGLTTKEKTAKYTFINFGQSGWTPEQYLARWKGLARADASGGTAMVYSIYSPNGFAGGDFTHQNMDRIQEMKENCLAAEKAAHDYGRIFIPAFVTGTNVFLAGKGDNDLTWMTKDLLDWAKERYGNQLLDLHSAVQPTGEDATRGPSMDNRYTSDQTHPNWDGYDALGKKAVEVFESVYMAARAAQVGK